MNESRRQDSSVLRGVRTGEATAMDEVRKRVERIIAFRGYNIPHQDREEITQQVLVQIWQAANKEAFDPAKGFWGFVQVVTVRRCIDWIRQKRTPETKETSTLPATTRGPLGRILDSERQAVAENALSQLGSRCRELIKLRISAGRTYAEIARMTNRSEQALRAQMYRCIKAAQGFVEKALSDEFPLTTEES